MAQPTTGDPRTRERARRYQASAAGAWLMRLLIDDCLHVGTTRSDRGSRFPATAPKRLASPDWRAASVVQNSPAFEEFSCLD